MVAQTAVDTLMQEIISYVLISEAYRAEESSNPRAVRTSKLDEDESKLMPELAKAFGIHKDEFARNLVEYDQIRLGHDNDMKKAIEGIQERPDGSLNPDYSVLSGVVNAMEAIIAKEALRGRIDVLQAQGFKFAQEHDLTTEHLNAAEAGALDLLVNAADLGSVIRFPTDDRQLPGGINPLRIYAHNVGAFKHNQDIMKQRSLTLGFMHPDSDMAKALIYEWIRDAEHPGFFQDNLRELLVGFVSGVGYDPLNPESSDHLNELTQHLYCRLDNRLMAQLKDNSWVPFEEVEDSEQQEVIKTPEGKVTKIKAAYNPAHDSYAIVAADSGNAYPLTVEKKLIPKGTTINDFLSEHRPKALARERELHAGMQDLIENGNFAPERTDLAKSYEFRTLFKMYDAYRVAAKTKAEGGGLDEKGRFSKNEQVLFKKALEFAGFSHATALYFMNSIEGGVLAAESASFDRMESLYNSNPAKTFRDSNEYKMWRKQVGNGFLARLTSGTHKAIQ